MPTKEAKRKLQRPISKAISVLEFVLGAIVVIGTAWYLFISISALVAEGFAPGFFEVFIGILLTAIIGVEIARVLVTHNLMGILELIAFVMARKILEPDATTIDLLIVVVAFGVLVYVRKLIHDQKIINPYEDEDDEDEKTS